MAFTVLKKLSVQPANSANNAWGAGGVTGVDLNTGVMGPLDSIVAGLSTFSVSASNVSLTFVAGGGGDVSNCAWRFTGTLTASIVVSPAAGDATTYLNGFYYFENLSTGSFTITVTTAAGSVVLPQGRRGTLFIDGTNGPRIFSLVGSGTADPIPAGSTTIWYQSAAPAGWSAVAMDDFAVKIATVGGVTSGSVPYSTLFERTATDGYSLLVPDLPPHTHTTPNFIEPNIGGGPGFGGGSLYSPTTPGSGTGTTGSGNPHSHNIAMRVKTAAFVLASRN